MSSAINKTTYQYLKSINTPDYSEDLWVINPDLSAVSGVAQKYWKVVDGAVVEMSTQEKQAVDAAMTQAYIESVISKAIAFGNGLITKYAAENVMLGITQAGMTSTVRSRMTDVISAIQTGSLYDVIHEIKTFPEENKDAVFITNARLLLFCNKIEAYLGITLSTTL